MRRARSIGGSAALAVFAGALALGAASRARAEYSPRMEPGRLAVRHASWAAANECRALWPPEHGASVELRVVLDRRGRVRSVAAMPEARAFARCVRRELAPQRFSVTGPDAQDARWEVVTRFVFPDEPAP
jgi:hypothetical protein